MSLSSLAVEGNLFRYEITLIGSSFLLNLKIYSGTAMNRTQSMQCWI